MERWFPVGGSCTASTRSCSTRPPGRRPDPADAARARRPRRRGARARHDRSRGDARPGLDRSGERPRVLVMGDSLVMAENVPASSTFVSQLTGALEEELDLPPGRSRASTPGARATDPISRSCSSSAAPVNPAFARGLRALRSQRPRRPGSQRAVRARWGADRAAFAGGRAPHRGVVPGRRARGEPGPRSFACSTRSARAAPSRTSSAVIPYRSISPRFASSGTTPSRGGPSIRSSRTSTTSTWRSGWTSAGVRRSPLLAGIARGCSPPSDHPRSSASAIRARALRRRPFGGRRLPALRDHGRPGDPRRIRPRGARRDSPGALRSAGANASDLDPPLRASRRPRSCSSAGPTRIHWNARGQRWAARTVARHSRRPRDVDQSPVRSSLEPLRRALGSRPGEGGTPDRIRTCDLRLRRPTLYPAELRALSGRDPRARLREAPASPGSYTGPSFARASTPGGEGVG